MQWPPFHFGIPAMLSNESVRALWYGATPGRCVWCSSGSSRGEGQLLIPGVGRCSWHSAGVRAQCFKRHCLDLEFSWYVLRAKFSSASCLLRDNCPRQERHFPKPRPCMLLRPHKSSVSYTADRHPSRWKHGTHWSSCHVLSPFLGFYLLCPAWGLSTTAALHPDASVIYLSSWSGKLYCSR